FIRSPSSPPSPSRTSSRKFFGAARQKWICSYELVASSGSLIFFYGSAPSPNLFFCRNAGRIFPCRTWNAPYRNLAGESERAELCPTRLPDNLVRRGAEKLSETTPPLAPVVGLLFVGAVFVTAASHHHRGAAANARV